LKFACDGLDGTSLGREFHTVGSGKIHPNIFIRRLAH